MAWNRFGERANLIDFDQDAVGDPFIDSALESGRIGHKQIVADQLNPFAATIGQHFPAIPIVFAAAIFNRADWIPIGPLCQKIHHCRGIKLLAVDTVQAFSGVKKFRCRDVKRNLNLLARSIAGFLNCHHDQIQGFDVAAQVGRKSAFVTNCRIELFVLQVLSSDDERSRSRIAAHQKTVQNQVA